LPFSASYRSLLSVKHPGHCRPCCRFVFYIQDRYRQFFNLNSVLHIYILLLFHSHNGNQKIARERILRRRFVSADIEKKTRKPGKKSLVRTLSTINLHTSHHRIQGVFQPVVAERILFQLLTVLPTDDKSMFFSCPLRRFVRHSIEPVPMTLLRRCQAPQRLRRCHDSESTW